MGLRDAMTTATVDPNRCRIVPVTLQCDTNRAIQLSVSVDPECPVCASQGPFKFLVRVRRTNPPGGTVVAMKFVDAITPGALNGTVIPICETVCASATYDVDIFAAECVTMPCSL
ncbi:hypothetical protein GJ688_15605 [Heliobacillus mobilis]|uniref:Uncharacterized protein n=1 Tax=Heliobacterium mobile TaxID=28064 RepID=A0A6I3SN16_HELMO|nr:hypothetical protein [Heliobacterium mobile]MTV50390.1 hypothetical protein [Heliobacterium mobile]